jgi:hypothetical protein
MARLDITNLRLRNQRIAGLAFSDPVEVVRWLGAVQAQDYAGAKWALGLRMQQAVEADIEQAFDSGSILRTHVLRPTWHFVTPEDIRWLLALTAPRVHVVNGSMYRKLDLDSATLERGSAVLRRALEGGQQLTRNELGKALEKDGIQAAEGLRLAYLVMYAELEGVICSGARRGKQFTYALLDERAPQAKVLDRAEALGQLAERYFISRGPATVQDFAKWSGLTLTEARQGVEAVGGTLEKVEADGRTFWLSTTPPPVQSEAPVAHLLSIYDEYVSGYKDYSDIMTEETGAKLAALGNALTYIMVVKGQIVGTWRRTLRREAVVIELNPFMRLSDTDCKAVTQAAERYGRFLGLRVEFASG